LKKRGSIRIERVAQITNGCRRKPAKKRDYVRIRIRLAANGFIIANAPGQNYSG